MTTPLTTREEIEAAYIKTFAPVEEYSSKLIDFMVGVPLSILEAIQKEVEGKKKVPTKHDRCTLDDAYCYDHQEIMSDEDYPNGATDYNTALSDFSSLLTRHINDLEK